MFGINLKETHWQRRVLVGAGVVSLLLAYPPFSIYPLAWLAPVFLFWSLALTPLRKSFRYAYFFGFLFNFFSFYWISYVTGGGWIFACFFQALYWGVFGLGARFLMTPLLESPRLRFRIAFALGVSGLWVSLEWLRVNLPGFGFGWNLLSYSQALFLPFIQTAEWIGAYGISFLILLGSALFFLTLWDLLRGVKHGTLFIGSMHSLLYVSLFLVLLLGPLALGYFRLKEPLSDQTLRVGVIQGNIPQELKWNPEVKDKIIEKYVKLSELLLYDRPDMVLWPEAAYPGYLLNELESSGIAKLIRESKVPYLIGSPRYEDATGNLYNSAVWFSPAGKPEAVYDKRNLVPYGEYVPLKRLFFFLEKLAYSFGVGEFSPGQSWQVFQGPLDTRFASLICFENIFPSLTSRFVKGGAEFFVVITNDSWFQKSRAPYEHLYASIFRAIETRRPFVHAANTGVSGYIDANGRLADTLRDKNGRELFVTGAMARPIAPQKEITFYVRWGHLVPLAALLVFLVSLGFSVRFRSWMI